MGAIGPPLAALAVAALMDSLHDQKQQVRVSAGKSLGRIGEPAKDAIPILVGWLDSDDRWDRAGAAEGLGEFGALAAQAIPALEDQRKHEDIVVRTAVSKALKLIRAGAS